LIASLQGFAVYAAPTTSRIGRRAVAELLAGSNDNSRMNARRYNEIAWSTVCAYASSIHNACSHLRQDCLLVLHRKGFYEPVDLRLGIETASRPFGIM
jgi:hypothetical protein